MRVITKDSLEQAYRLFHQGFYKDKDPVGLVHRYSEKKDQEVIGLAVALLSYGNVTSIRKNAEKILNALGPRPAEVLGNLYWPENLDGFCHRFTRCLDLKVLFYRMGKCLEQHDTLENTFARDKQSSMKETLASFVESLEAVPLPENLKQIAHQRQRNLKYLVSNPNSGSACKRLNMYLRWMIRPNDGIDLGTWTKLLPKDLILPIDTHILQTIQKARWTKSKTANWKVAEAATSKLRNYCPEDPVRYDFSLCHLSMHKGTL